VAFISAWTIGSITTSDYSALHDPISRLAAVGADSRALMTSGFVVFGLSLPVYAYALARTVRGWAWLAATLTGLATLGVAATPLDRSPTVDTWHGVFAGIGYATLAAIPLLAARPLRRAGCRHLSRWGVAAGSLAGIALALTLTDLPTGLFQRLGLTVVDAWIVISALAIMTARLPAEDAGDR
jgi:hypothetical protein